MVREQYISAPPVEDIKAKQVIIHKNFSLLSGHNDIALIKLSENVVTEKSKFLNKNY